MLISFDNKIVRLFFYSKNKNKILITPFAQLNHSREITMLDPMILQPWHALSISGNSTVQRENNEVGNKIFIPKPVAGEVANSTKKLGRESSD